jgi:RimJ/RimL family protein N-acetyltransferase
MNLEGKTVRLMAVEREDLEVLKDLRNEHLPDNIFRQYRPLTSLDQDGYWAKVINSENFIAFTICIPDVDMDKREEFTVFTDEGARHVYTRKGWTVIGECRVGYINWRNRWAELGIFLGKEYMGKGYGREALWLLMEYAFANLGLHAIRAETVTEKVKELFMEFAFTYIGTTEGTTFNDGRYLPDHILELYEETWFLRRGGIYEGSVEPHFVKADTIIQDTVR